MPAKVLDSFALIAYFRDEPGAEMMEDMLVAAGKKDSPLLMTRCELRRGEVLHCEEGRRRGVGGSREGPSRACRLIFIPRPARWPTLRPISRRASN